MIRLQELELVFKQTDERTDGWTHRRDVGNSILDMSMGLRKSEKFDFCHNIYQQSKYLTISTSTSVHPSVPPSVRASVQRLAPIPAGESQDI